MMLKNTLLFFASSCIAITGAFASETEENLLLCDKNIEVTEENVLSLEQVETTTKEAALSFEEVEATTENNLGCDEEVVIIEPEDGVLACNSCKDLYSCSCHGKGKTKELALDSSSDVNGTNDNLACGCMSDNETEI